MFSSLRFRFFLTYAILIAAVLSVIFAALLVFLVPFRHRQTVERLRVISRAAARRSVFQNLAVPKWQTAVEKADKAWGARLAVVDAQGNTLADSRSATAGPIPPSASNPGVRQAAQSSFRDERGRAWLYADASLPGGNRLIAAVPRQRASAVSLLLRDEFFRPFLQAGLLALLLSLALAIWIARWVAAPLQRIAAAARQVADGTYDPIPVEGPGEVQELARAFNEMSGRVKDNQQVLLANQQVLLANQQVLEKNQQVQRDFVANVSHELKTPLTSIRGFAQAILEGAVEGRQELEQAARVIYDEAGRMHRLVLDLLDLARLDSGIAGLERAPVDLTGLLNAVITKAFPLVEQGRIELQGDIDPLLSVPGDSDRLVQVFTNLMDNAIQHTPAGGKVTVSARVMREQRDRGAATKYVAGEQGSEGENSPEAGLAVQVTVADSGSGILPEDLPHIFDRFYQADKSRQGGVRRGSGLGLTLAREIIQAHSGTLTVESTPGLGSTFMVKLPC